MDPALNNPPQSEQSNGSATPNPTPRLDQQSSTSSLPLPVPQSQQTSQQSQTSHTQTQHGHPPQQSAQQTQQQGQHSEQRAPPPPPVSYPSSAGYPSPGLGANNNQYAYPPAQPQQQQQVSQEPYRASPTGSNGSMSLPSISSLNPLQQQQQVQQAQPIQQQQYNASPLPPPNVAQQMPAYYHSAQTLPHPGHQGAYPLGVSMPDVGGANMRYALPPTDHRVMSGGRHKKEIKRRTKTGCLTCRKRRIKCDEQHPACRNCQKSKRECLGYDPIFKQQPGPPQIQPAPHSSAAAPPTTITTSNPYGNQPLMQGYGPNMSYDPNMPGSAQNFDYSGTIDPALEAVAGQQQPAQPHPGYAPGIHPSYDHHPSHMGHQPPVLSYNPADVARHAPPAQQEGAVPPHSYYPSYPVAAPVPPPVSQTSYAATGNGANSTPSAPPKIVKIEDLLIKLPTSETKYEPEQSVIDEIRQMYLSIYIPGLESFLESRWFTVEGTDVLMKDSTVLEHFSKLLTQFMKASEHNEQEMMYAYQIEVRVVWELAQQVSQATGLSSAVKAEGEGGESKPRELPASGIPTPEDAEETLNRLRVWEHLLSGTIAPSNPLANPIGKISEHHKLRELDFWYSLGKFVTLPIHDNTPLASSQIDETLSHLRNLLDGRENRDVLYSVAVVRALGQRVSEYGEEEKVEGVYLDEQDARSKVVVAKRFVGDEAGRGTTNVIRRFCELACRALGIGMGGLVAGGQ